MNPKNVIQYWGFFSRKEILQNQGKLLMLDVDFGRSCSLHCPTCYRRKNPVDSSGTRDLTYDELLNVIDEARTLGLQSVKICGAGEPTEDRRFLQFVQDMTQRGIGVACFTKGQVLGSDSETNRIFGIDSAFTLCQQLFGLKVSFMLSWQSFRPAIQDAIVGKSGHSYIRDQVFDNLVRAGFNKPLPTRLSLNSNPITKQNIHEIFNLYVFARKQNILPVTAVHMVSGEQYKNPHFLSKFDVSDQHKIELWTRIYAWNIENGIHTMKNISDEGISALPGISPCNQIACGMYITANGNVVSCPGSNVIEGNVREKPLKEIWEASENKKRAGIFNCYCPPKDGITIPDDLYHQVLKNLIAKYV